MEYASSQQKIEQLQQRMEQGEISAQLFKLCCKILQDNLEEGGKCSCNEQESDENNILLHTFRNKKVNEQGIAAESLTQLVCQQGPSVPELLKALVDMDTTVRQVALKVLLQIGEAAKPELLKALRHSNITVRQKAAKFWVGSIFRLC